MKVENKKGASFASLISEERNLPVVTHSLFSAWMLAVVFEGRILYALAEQHFVSPTGFVFGGIAWVFLGLLSCGFFVKTKKAAKLLFRICCPTLILSNLVFFFRPSALWTVGITLSSFAAGCSVAAWAFYLKDGSPKGERLKMIADLLILSNVLMIVLNLVTAYLSSQVGLAVSILMLLLAFVLSGGLPEGTGAATDTGEKHENRPSLWNLLAFLSLFIVVITINSGLMYHVINPAFAHLERLSDWYWAIPYIAAIVAMKRLPKQTNRTYILFSAIAMIGLSFVFFMGLNRSVSSYLIVNTLMLGACGIYDLFWWSILGEMLDFDQNPVTILGVGLSANVLGVLLGGIVGNAITSSLHANSPHSTLLALTVVCITLALLPPLHTHLSSLLTGHTYLNVFSQMPAQKQTARIDHMVTEGNLSERETQVASLLIHGKTYKAIADELYISINTVKYYVKNIYSKFNVGSRAELMHAMLKKDD